jgi:hypothetical protein
VSAAGDSAAGTNATGLDAVRYFCVVPTTAGPNGVRALSQRRDLPASVVFQNSNFRPLSWSRDYDQFLLPSGPVRSLIPSVAEGAFVLRVDDDIDGGRSWEVPTLLLHVLFAQGHAIAPSLGEADVLVWSTGALDFDDRADMGAQRITPQDYALVTKVEASRALFDEAVTAGLRVVIILPPGPGSDEAQSLLANILGGSQHTIIRSDTLEAGLNALPEGLPVVATRREVIPLSPRAISPVSLAGVPALKETYQPPRVARSKGPLLAGALGLVIVAGAAAWAFMSAQILQTGAAPTQLVAAQTPVEQPKLQPEKPVEMIVPTPALVAPAAPKPWLMLHELRAPAGFSCIDAIAQGESFVRVAINVEEGKPVISRARDICGLDYSPANGSTLQLDRGLEALALRRTLQERADGERRLVLGGRAPAPGQPRRFTIEGTQAGETRKIEHELVYD